MLPKFSWSKNTVIRGGYGINYNTDWFPAFARSISFQPPFAQTQTNNITIPTVGNPTPIATGCTTTTPAKTVTTAGGVVTIPGTKANFTLANGFGGAAGSTGCSTLQPIHNNYSVNKNYRLGMVQVYNLNIQRSLPQGIILNIGYNGAKGGNLDVVGSPNSTPSGDYPPASPPSSTRIPSPARTPTQLARQPAEAAAEGHRARHHLHLLARHRQHLHHRRSQRSAPPVQNFYRLDLEEANSSFDQRHPLTGNWLLELPFGPNREFLNKGGVMAKVLDGFSSQRHIHIRQRQLLHSAIPGKHRRGHLRQ